MSEILTYILLLLLFLMGFAFGRKVLWGELSRDWKRISVEWDDLSREWGEVSREWGELADAHLRIHGTPRK